MSAIDYPAYAQHGESKPVRARFRLPDECPRWLRITVLCWFWVVCGICFMGAVNSFYYPF